MAVYWAVLIALLMNAPAAIAQTATVTTLYSFSGGANGGVPFGGLVQGTDGNLYGTTTTAGSSNQGGTVFKITPAGALTTLYSFTGGADGSGPYAGLVRGSDGNFYGLTLLGGTSNNGTVFKITPSGTLTTLYSFSGADGGRSAAALVQGNDGNFYGTTPSGGNSSAGTVFKITPAGAFTRLYSFSTSGNNGVSPSSLVLGSDGNFYGTTNTGGKFATPTMSGYGTVFRISPSGTYTLLYSFTNGTDGSNPSGLVFGSDHVLHGTTARSGSGYGTLFSINPTPLTSPSTYPVRTLHLFNGSTEGGTPSYSGLVQGSDGNLYGTTIIGGAGYGTVFASAADNANLTTLYSFPTGAVGNSTYGVLMQASDGRFYGVTQIGGTNSLGSIFKVVLPTATTPTFSPVGGTYAGTQTVSISNSIAGATIFYTTDGSTPTTSSTPYTGAISVASSQTIKAIATALGYSNSAVASATYTIQVPAAAPTFSPAGGTFTSSQSVTISDSTAGATIRYTTDGSTPTAGSALYAGAITVSSSTTIKAIAIASGYANSAVTSATYTLTPPAATPTISPAGGTYNSTQSVTISDSTAGATIRYTVDGSTPTASSAAYAGPISVFSSQTIKAIAVASGYANSAVASATYTITPPAATPSFSPSGGTYSTAQSVTISDSTPGATIRYTVDGSTPTTSSLIYSSPISIASSQTLKAIAIASGYSASAAASASYTIVPPAAAPGFNPAGGTYASPQSVTLTDSTPGAVIHYTTDGSTPTAGSPTYSSPIPVSSSQTIKAMAVASGYTPSTISSATYTITLPVPAATPTFSPAGGKFTSSQSVLLSDSTPGAVIYYTTDGSTPTPSSTPYTGAIVVSTTKTIKAMAVASGYTNSAVAAETYTITTSSGGGSSGSSKSGGGAMNPGVLGGLAAWAVLRRRRRAQLRSKAHDSTPTHPEKETHQP